MAAPKAVGQDPPGLEDSESVSEDKDATVDGGDVVLVEQSALDQPVWTALTGPHARFAETVGGAARYPIDVAPFAAVSPDAKESDWDDLAALVGPGAIAPVLGGESSLPPDWAIVDVVDCLQMVDVEFEAEDHPRVVRLGASDVPEMLDLVERTQPGPFRPRTIELGTYLGIRDRGALIAMAGQRLHPPGWTEISAVCTDPAHRNEGLATLLMRAVAADIRGRGEAPFLHVADNNTNAIRLYESLGFVSRGRVRVNILRSPQ
jgi:ribosomal protein S18 acetylase RimI-like enzyme